MSRGAFYDRALLSLSSLLADEQVGQVQEELRKRNLYFGDIDGQPRPELAKALRRYQGKNNATGVRLVEVYNLESN